MGAWIEGIDVLSRSIVKVKVLLWLVSLLLLLPLRVGAEGVHRLVLENGLRVVLVEDHSRPVVAYQVWVGSGSADESEGEAGVAHLIEHMIFKPTQAYPQGVARLVEGLGGRVNAFTSYEYTVFHLAVSRSHHLEALRALADAVLHPRFDPSELAKEKEVVLEEISMGEDQPRRKFHKRLWRRAFSVHPYGRPVIGYRKTVSSFKRQDLLSFWRRWYVPDNMVVVAVGDLSSSEVQAEIERLFGPLRGRAPRRVRPREPFQRSPRALLERGASREYYVDLAFHIPDVKSPDFYPLEVLSAVLTSGRSSRLVRRLKEERALVTSVYSYAFLSRDPGLFVVGASPVPGKVREALDGLLEELRLVARKGVDPEELARAKKGLETSFLYDRETVQGEAETLGYFETILGDARKVAEYLKGLKGVTPDEVRGVARRYFRREGLTLGLMVPGGEGPSEEELLRYAARLGEEGGLRRCRLPNGATLLFLRDPSLPLVGITVAFEGGLRYEEEGKAGLTQLLSKVLTRGTGSRTALEIAEEVDALGARLSAFAGRNSFGIEAEGLSRDFSRLLELVAELVMDPAFPLEELDKAKAEQLAALRRQRDDLSWRAFQAFRSFLFRRHPYRLNPLGTEETIEGISREDLLRYWKAYAVPPRMVLAVVGDLEWEEVRKEVQRAFGPFSGKGVPPPSVPKEQRPKAPREKRITYGKGEQAHLVLGFLGASIRDEDRFPLEVLGAVLGRQGGRFFRRLRDEMALGYEVFFFVRCDLDPGYLGAYVATSPEKVAKATEGIKGLLREVLERGVTEREVEEAKRYLIGNYQLGLQGVLSLSSTVALNELYGLGGGFFEIYPRRIEAVTARQVAEVARRYIDLQAYTLVVLSPSSE